MQPECFVCSNAPLVFSVFEEAMRRGLESNWEALEGGLYVVEVYHVTRTQLGQIVDFARGGCQLALPIAA